MKHLLFPVALLALCLGTQAAISSPEGSDEPLHVMIQGDSSEHLRELVEREGGKITHDLHIIGAVGAKLTEAQLGAVLDAPGVSRYINDLDLPDEVEDEEDKDKCRVRGHIELDFTESGISWGLYNKKDKAAELAKLTFSWPQYMGTLKSLTLSGKTLAPVEGQPPVGNKLQLEFPDNARPIIEDIAVLRAQFNTGERGPAPNPPRQSDFTIEAQFTADCATDLVPGYVNNHGDYYYNTVAGIDSLHQQQVTGAGVTVAIIDSGLWNTPKLLLNTRGKHRVLAQYDALTDSERAPLGDESGHGTHMTSIIAHSGPTVHEGKETGWYKGVAPDANIVAVKVLDRDGLAALLDIVRGVQWVVDNREKYNIRVLNLSFSQLPRWPYWEDPVNQAVMHAWKAGIAVVAAAGNDGPDKLTIGSPGNLPYIITVGAVTDSWTIDTRSDDYIPDFSSRGPTPDGHIKPDIVALGGHMTGLINPDAAMAIDQPEDTLRTGEFVSTGSSQASAFVSGVLALMLQLEPELTPDQLKCKLVTSAEPGINADGRLAYSPFAQGFGYASVIRAITLGRADCATGDLDIDADLTGADHFFGPALFNDDNDATLPDLDKLLSPIPAAKGLSTTRKWGVKDHLEREGYAGPPPGEAFDWEEIYRQEKATIERLAAPQ